MNGWWIVLMVLGGGAAFGGWLAWTERDRRRASAGFARDAAAWLVDGMTDIDFDPDL